jgi:hypothetical protein
MEKIEDVGTDAAHSRIVQPLWRKLDITMISELRFPGSDENNGSPS